MSAKRGKQQSTRGDGVQAAVERLQEEARRRLEAHPWGHLLAGRRETLRLPLELPLNGRPQDLPRVVEALDAALAEAIQGVLAHQAVVRPGQVYCLRCSGAEGETACEHARPPGPRHVFTGYGPTGIPRFADFGQWLLERQDPRVDLLYRQPPRLVTLSSSGEELVRELLAVYRDPGTGYRLHGQVAAGFYSLPDAQGNPRPAAISVQIVSSHAAAEGTPEPRRQRAAAPRFALNVVGVGPDGEDLSELYARLGELPWRDTLRWGQEALASVETAAGRRRRRSGKALAQRLEGILGGIARRLERVPRARRRRTGHGEQRHREGDRPTSMALTDLRRAGRDELLFDVRNETLIVLGDRGRAHVFSPEGKLVTSVRYSPPAIERRRRSRRWRQATPVEVAGLEKTLGSEVGSERRG